MNNFIPQFKTKILQLTYHFVQKLFLTIRETTTDRIQKQCRDRFGFLSSMIERLHSIPENHIILSYTEESFYSFFLFSSNYFVSLMNPLIVSIVVWYFVIDILHAVFCNKIDICLLFDLEPCNIFATWMFGV